MAFPKIFLTFPYRQTISLGASSLLLEVAAPSVPWGPNSSASSISMWRDPLCKLLRGQPEGELTQGAEEKAGSITS